MPSLHGYKVLVVDDEFDVRELLTVILEISGATVISASSAKEAMNKLCIDGMSSLPDVIISDIGMPVEDGYTFIKKVRSLPPESGGNIPAIAVTAFSREEDRIRAFSSGFQAFRTKPIDPEDLINSIRSLVSEEI